MGTRTSFYQQQSQDDFSSYFNRSVSAVQACADQLEHEYARPALQTFHAFFNDRPIFTTFVTTFSLLSLLPFASFIGFSLFVIASCLITALTCASITSAIVISIFLTFLLFALLAILLTSAVLTGLIVSTFSVIQLFMLTRKGGRSGLSKWITEMKRLMFGPKSCLSESNERRESATPGGPVVEVKVEDGSSWSTESPHEGLYSDGEIKGTN